MDSDRRKFLKVSLAGIITGSYPGKFTYKNKVEDEIKYVTLGRTGMRVSNIGYGTSKGSIDPSILKYAIEKGINYFDTSEGYSKGNAERSLGKVIKGIRNKVFINTKVGSIGAEGRLTKDTTLEEILDRVKASLTRLDTPYIDSLFIHNAGDPDLGGLENKNLHKAFEILKSEGKVKFFGLSCHQPNLIKIVKRALELNLIDLMIIPYNFSAKKGYPELNKILSLAKEKNVGITTMKNFVGAGAANIMKKRDSQIKQKQAAVKWVLSNPLVDVAVISFGNITEIDAICEVSNKKIGLIDRKILEKSFKKVERTLCRIPCDAPCELYCPNNVAISSILRYNMYYEDYGWKKEGKFYYKILKDKRKANKCLDCSSLFCEEGCKFNIPVRRKLIESIANLQ